MIIRNFKTLATTRERRDALTIINAGIEAVLVKPALRAQIHRRGDILAIRDHRWNLLRYNRVFVVGAGKASLDAAEVLEEVLGARITEGIMIDTRGKRFPHIHVIKGTHPLPSHINVVATQKIIRIFEQRKKNDLVIALFSGGGSALFESPRIPLRDYIELTHMLLKRGASITEINTVRKHLSFVKGGQLAQIGVSGTIITLLISDVLSNDASVIASGPTTPDSTSMAHARSIQKKYSLPHLPFVETPKDRFSHVYTSFLITNSAAVDAMSRKARKLGYRTRVLGTQVQGEARAVGKKIALLQKKGTAIIGAGETTVTVKGKGIGGRNQELVLGALSTLKQGVIASCASDGVDFITQAAGGIVDITTKECAKKKDLDAGRFLRDNNSYAFLKKVNGVIVTGKTGTNVGDLMVALSGRA